MEFLLYFFDAQRDCSMWSRYNAGYNFYEGYGATLVISQTADFSADQAALFMT